MPTYDREKGTWDDEGKPEKGIQEDWPTIEEIGHLEKQIVPVTPSHEENKNENPTPWDGLI